MRTAKKLSLAVAALLLVNCGVSTDESLQSNESAATSGTVADSREGLTPFRATSKAARVMRSDAVTEAINYLSSSVARSLDTAPEFKAINVTTSDSQDGLTHVRLQQTLNGVTVWGADAVVHLNGSEVLGASGTVASRLAEVSKARKAAVLSSDEALAKAKADRFGDRKVVTDRDSVERIIFVDDTGAPHEAFHASFFNELQGSVQPALWNLIYDASTGAVLARWNELHTVEQASGPGGNPKYVHSWNSELDVEPRGDGYVLTTSRLVTYNMNQGSSTASEVTGPLDAIGDAPINDAHGFAEITLNVLKEWMGRDSIDDRGFVIKSRVHYNRNYENAFWDGRQMTYGDGANRFYPLSGGLDVCAHEIHHGFTSKHSNLTYSGESGGMNESFSDIAGKVAEFYYKDAPNWDLGGDVFKEPNKALRYMCEPTKDNRSIDNLANYRPGIDVHYSSGIGNKAFCLASKRMSNAGDATGTATRDGVKRTASAFYLANASYWTSSSKYVAVCQGTLDAARALEFTEEEIQNIKTSWADVGVACN